MSQVPELPESPQQTFPGIRYGEALEDFRDKWLHGMAFMVVADKRRFSLISKTKPSTSFELMLNSGPLMGFMVAVRISAEGISGINTGTLHGENNLCL